MLKEYFLTMSVIFCDHDGGEVSLGWDVDLFLSQLLVVRKLKMLDFSDFADTEFELTG